MEIRLARVEDAGAIREIYAPYVELTTVSFEATAPTTEEMAGRITNTLKTYPYLVCQEDDKVAGYAYASRYRARAAYDWCAELSVYVSGDYFRRGVGRALYEVLVELLKAQSLRRAYAAISLPNDASVALHEALGFELMCLSRDAGYKLGGWHDMAMYELEIIPADGEPAALVPVGDLDPDTVAEVLRVHTEKINNV